MCFRLIIKSYDFACKYLENDIMHKPIEKFSQMYYKIQLDDFNQFIKKIEFIMYHSRLIEDLYLEFATISDNSVKINNEIANMLNKEYKQIILTYFNSNNIKDISSKTEFQIDINENYSIKFLNHNNTLLLSLNEYNLTKRDYMINKQDKELNSILINYLFYLMELDKNQEQKFSVIDPLCNTGKLIIECSFFNKDMAINVRNRLNFPVFKLFGHICENIVLKNHNNYTGIVNDNQDFKCFRENVNFTNQKIKISKYDLDWLDVKFKKGDLDYCISYLKSDLDKKKVKEFFYQAEFITKKTIGIISDFKIDEKILKKYSLKTKIFDEIIVFDSTYYIYIIVH